MKNKGNISRANSSECVCFPTKNLKSARTLNLTTQGSLVSCPEIACILNHFQIVIFCVILKLFVDFPYAYSLPGRLNPR